MSSISQLYDLSGQVAIVTGSGKGIGFGVASRLAEAGVAVVVNATSEASVGGAIERMRKPGMKLAGAVGDVSQSADVERILGVALESFGRVDILINNAAVFPPHPNFPDMSVEYWDRLTAVNLRGIFLCSQVVSKQMIAQRQGGKIVNMSSIAGVKVYEHSPVVYSATKAGILHLTRMCARLLAQHKIRVNAIVPGSIDTEGVVATSGVSSSMVPLGRRGKPEDVARAVLFLVSDMAEYITGATLLVDGGLALT